MAISAANIKIRQSQRLTDNPDGGGRMVQAEVVDGQLNNLFPNIGDEERTTGRSTLRKAFVHLDTPNRDILTDAIGIILQPPEDDAISVTMFSTGSYSDVRADARNIVESYITKGVESRYVLMGNHFIGQQAISVYCMPDAPTPDINDNFCLSTTAVGYTPNEQYVRVSEVLQRTTEEFTDGEGVFRRDVIIMGIGSALLYPFYGQEPVRISATKPPTRVFRTNVVEAASFYSVKALSEVAEAGDLSVKIDSPYVPIVPSTLAETPVVDELAGNGATAYVQAGPTNDLALTYSAVYTAGVAVTRFLGSSLAKGSVSVVVASVTLSDDGEGNLVTGSTTPWGGTVDYASGAISLRNDAGAGLTSASITATAAGMVAQQAYTQRKTIELASQTYNHVFSLSPLPAPGTTTVNYRALGKWIQLTDNGTGTLVGNPGEGTGTVNYATGTLLVTCGALPDLESDMLVGHGTGVTAERRDGDVTITPPELHFFLANEGVNPGTFTATLTVGASPVVASDSGGDGVLLIGGVDRGRIVYATGEVHIRPATLPDAGTQIVCEYAWSALENEIFTPTPDGGGIVAFTLPEAPVRPGSVALAWMVTVRPSNNTDLGAPTVSLRIQAKDNGAGQLVATFAGGAKLTGTLGTINYTSGAISLQAGSLSIANVPFPVYTKTGGRDYWRVSSVTRANGTGAFSAGTQLSADWQTAAVADTDADEAIPLPDVTLDLTPGIIDAVVPGSVRFVFRGHTYVDRSGSLYRTIDPVTGAGTYAGSIDYGSGIASLALWEAGGTNAVTMKALLTTAFEVGLDVVTFRTLGSPLAPGQFTLRATTLEGDLLTATGDVGGVITGSLIDGTVDWETGVVRVRFGEMVTAAGNEGEPWYDVENVVGGNVWKPHLVVASTIFYNAVVFKSLPLSSVVVGLDPTRLPPDGRVPCFKAGQTVLVHHTGETSLTPVAGTTTDLGRINLSYCEVRDSEGTPIDSVWYTIDLDAGTVEWSDPLNLAAYAMPVRIRHRIDNRRLCAGVQINGVIELNSALSRDFPEGTLLSTCLRLGEANGSLNLVARVENLFDQATWSSSSIWSDTVVGSPAAATYNDIDYPILVDNRSAITERWAIVFTGATAFELRGETVGTIATGSTGADFAPINPRTGEPYMFIDRRGWGLGWVSGNALRHNTIGGLAPVWFVRTVRPSTPEAAIDSFRFEVIGNSEEIEV
ncbi:MULTISPECIES: hypothetical protein [unclassified Pseudoxanthomonas]|uniref:hypothetical protein n=1 Tax=unclassified Pseudoxanthomonas TaxID=2645906 RepID=UPI00307D8D21